MYLPFVIDACPGVIIQQKTRDCLTIAGLLGNCLYRLAVPPRNASAAMPHGLLSISSLATQANCYRVFHLLTR